MTNKLTELWIIKNTGMFLLHLKNPKKRNSISVNPTIFSGIMTAMQFTANHKIGSIKMHDSKLMIVPYNSNHDCLLVGRTDIDQRDKNILKILQKIREHLKEDCDEIIQNWMGDLNSFDFFRDKIQNKFF